MHLVLLLYQLTETAREANRRKNNAECAAGKRRHGMKKWLIALLLPAMIAGCSVNPVTGKNELSIVSPQQEVAIGEKNYRPSRQSQGGDYYLDKSLQAYVNEVGQRLAAVSDRPDLPYEFVVLNNDVPNAWALPGGKIAINRGLLLLLDDEAQLAAVLGHEVVHAAARHGAAQMTRGTLANIGLVTLGVATQGSDGAQLYGMASQIGAVAWMAKYGRDDELESDHYGMNYMASAGYEVQGAVELQEKFVALSKSQQAGFLENLFASHPPSTQRVAENQARAANVAPGKRYRARYQAAIAQLKKDAPAYQAETAAKKALAEKQWRQAIQHLDKAVAHQPNEGHFWELRGHAWKMLEELNNAEKAYTTAIKKNDEFFSPYLARGVLLYERGEKTKAKADLHRSYKLLPTPTASYYLGELSLQGKQYSQASSYFKRAAQDTGALGKQSRQKLQAVQLQTQPQTFLATSLVVNSGGYLLVEITNTASRSMGQIAVEISGGGLRKTIRLPAVLKPKSTVRMNTGIAYRAEAQQNYRATALKAVLVD
jgi:beta-barrel assembly-enhancing protease